MAKLMNMFLVLIALQVAIAIYSAGTATDNVIWSFIMNTQGWGTTAWLLAIIGIAGGIGLVGIAAASTFGFKTDFLIFAPAIAGFLSIGTVFAQLANIIYSDLVSTFFTTCSMSPGSPCAPATFIVGAIIGPMALYYTWTVVEWWRGKDY